MFTGWLLKKMKRLQTNSCNLLVKFLKTDYNHLGNMLTQVMKLVELLPSDKGFFRIYVFQSLPRLI